MTSWLYYKVPKGLMLKSRAISLTSLVLDRLSIAFTSNGKRKFVPRVQVSPLLVRRLLLIIIFYT